MDLFEDLLKVVMHIYTVLYFLCQQMHIFLAISLIYLLDCKIILTIKNILYSNFTTLGVLYYLSVIS
jgi:hypothetical protein